MLNEGEAMKLNGMKWIASVAVVAGAACEQVSDPVGVNDAAEFAPAFAFTAPTIAVGELWVCKEGPAGTYNFTITRRTGTVNYTAAVTNGAFTVNAGSCVLVINNRLASGGYVGGSADVTEVVASLPSTVLFDNVLRYHFQGSGSGGDSGVPVAQPPSSINPTIFTSGVGNDNGQLLLYTNIAAPSTGCTLTLGYWKTHNDSFGGGAPTDATWALITPSAEQSPFFLSGNSWFGVFWTSPAGNQYYNLAHQYMAAVLNGLAGATVPAAVQTAMNQATTLFNTYTPAQIGVLKGNSPLRAQFVSLAGTLGSYNEGLTGPGHCD